MRKKTIINLIANLCSQENLEQCQSAAEFLLEPWILVQLPFQPLLFYQWSVALIAEALKFQMELGEFRYCPKQLRPPVTTLQEMNTLMFKAGYQFFRHYDAYMNRGVESLSSNVESIFLNQLPNVLPVIEFVLSDECRKIVKALTKMALDSHSVNNLFTIRQIDTERKYFSFCFHSHYWKQNSLVHSLSSKNPTMHAEVGNDDQEQATLVELQEIKNLVEEKFIKTGRLKGGSKEFFFCLLQEEAFYFPFVSLYRNYALTLG